MKKLHLFLLVIVCTTINFANAQTIERQTSSKDSKQAMAQVIADGKDSAYSGIMPLLVSPPEVTDEVSASFVDRYFWPILLLSITVLFLVIIEMLLIKKKRVKKNYDSLVNSMPTIFFSYKKLYDKRGFFKNDVIILDANKAFETAFCCRRGKITNRPLSKITVLHPELIAINSESIEQCNPFVVHQRNGGDVHLGNIIIESKKGDVVHVFCSDLTISHTAWHQTESYKHLLEDIINVIPVCVVVRDITDDMRFLLWNKKAEEIYGVTYEEITTLPDEVIRHNKLVAEDNVTDQEVVKSGANYNDVRRIRKANGAELTVAYNKYIIQHPNGNKLLITSAWDITEIQQDQESSAELNTQLQLVIKAAKMSRWTWNMKADIIHYNNEHARSLDNSMPLTKNQTKRELFGSIFQEDLQTFVNAYELVRKGMSSGFDLEIRTKNYTDRDAYTWIHIFCSVSKYDEEGKPMILAGATVNIERQKQLERNLRLSKEDAEFSNKQKSIFLTNLSHEIRTPLSAIVGFSSVLARTDNAEEKEEFNNIIKTNSTALLQLFDCVVELSRIEANELEFNYEMVDVNSLFEELEESTRKYIRNPSIDVTFTERLHGGVKVCTDKNRLMQVMNNLVSNSIKNTSEGVIEFGYRRNADGHLYFFLSDTGEGIPSDKQGAVFERFVKLDSSKQGLGLGLAICKTIINKMGGEIGVNSKVGKGSTFWFAIPEQKTPTYFGSSETKHSGQYPTKLDESDKKPLILIAEDNVGNFRLFEIVLRKNYRIIHARNGEEAVTLYKKHHPQLILMDIRMPKLDGYGATAQIRKFSESVPIIAVTAFAFKEDELRIAKSGFTAYLTKPIKTQLLFDKIERLLEAKKNTGE